MNARSTIRLVVSVDTEEEGLWNVGFPVRNNTTTNLRGLARFQALCERHGMPPTYLVTAPVLDDEQAVAEMSKWQQESRCEVGAHCHPWCNPPIVAEQVSSRESYLSNLPRELQYEKLAWLTDAIADRMGVRPTSFRAGRYGFSFVTARCLIQLGYTVDSSHLPLFAYPEDGGPDFRMHARLPHRLVDSSKPGSLIEIPVTTGFTRPGYELRRRIYQQTRQPIPRKLRLAGIADRLGIARRVKLSPEGTQTDDLKQLISAGVRDGLQTLVLMLHSSSLVAGCSPYCASEADFERFLSRLDSCLGFARTEFQAEGVTLTQAAVEIDQMLD
ncbi:polysaccharide deacetylase family protein [Allorhodopirellula heiligendammensis]|uniref:Polysaccharide deacetylase n=1 Tax=Allorhodopirellula heiligendammensis TaxID=2714739 RepID=A0A5C6C787_9BACT|nr:polysaccharide deacetylase family protein [Allorhodopirellula heiligendammensis]TWU19992.1 hypothetical protein Poly21_21710 [Allorhodopirellula heiligendammensis]